MRSTRLALAAVAVVAGGALAVSSPDGLRVSPDAVAFGDAANNLADGHGLVMSASYPNLEPTTKGRRGFPLVHWPPLHPAALAALTPVADDPVDASRWLICALLAANVGLFGLMVGALTGGSRAATLAGAAVFAISPAGIPLHAKAASEPLFIFLAFAGLQLLALYLLRRRAWLLAAAGAALGLSLLTRYAGTPVLAVAFLGLLAYGEGSAFRRLLRAGVFSMAVALPLLAWIARNVSRADTATGRSGVGWHPPTGEDLQGAVGWVAAWFAPTSPAAALRALIAAIVVVLLAVGFAGLLRRVPARRRWDDARSVRMMLLAAFGVLYLISLLVSRTFFDAANPLDDRGFAPAYVAFGVCAAALIADAVGAARRRHASLATATLAAGLGLVGAAYVQQTAEAAVDLYNAREGYRGDAWTGSPTVVEVRKVPLDVTVYSNAPEAIFLLTGRRAESVPVRTDPIADEPYGGYDRALRRLGRRAKAGRAVVVQFDDVDRPYLPGPEELSRSAGLRRVRRTADGALYAAAPRGRVRAQAPG